MIHSDTDIKKLLEAREPAEVLNSDCHAVNLISDPLIIYQIANIIAKSDSIGEGYSYSDGYATFDSWKSALAEENSTASEYRRAAIDILNCVRDWYLKVPGSRCLTNG